MLLDRRGHLHRASNAGVSDDGIFSPSSLSMASTAAVSALVLGVAAEEEGAEGEADDAAGSTEGRMSAG